MCSESIVTPIIDHYNQMSAQRELDKNVTVVVRSICITQGKILFSSAT